MSISRFKIKPPNEIWNIITYNCKFGFCAGFICAILQHMLVFSNLLVNHDGIFHIKFNNDMLTSGRWFLKFASALSTDYTLPWLIGILCAVAFGLQVAIIVYLFKINSRMLILLLAAFTVSVPNVVALFTYFFTADAYLLALLLAAISVLLTRNTKYGIGLGILLLGASIGIYQAYIGYAALLIIILIIYDALSTTVSIKQCCIRIFKYIFLGIGGYIVNLIGLNIRLRIENLALTDYQGISQMGKINLAELPNKIKIAYQDFFGYLFGERFYNGIPNWAKAANLCMLLCIVLIITILIFKRKIYKSKGKTCLVIFFTLLIPLGAMIIELITNKETYYYLLMFPQLVLLPTLFFILLSELGKEKINTNLKSIILWVSILCSGLLLYHYTVKAQISYQYLQSIKESAYTQCSMMMNKITNLDGYNEKMPIMFIGENQKAQSYIADTDYILNPSSLLNNDAKAQVFMILFMNIDCPIADEQSRSQILASEKIKEMGIWPAKNSIEIIDDTVVIKFSEKE